MLIKTGDEPITSSLKKYTAYILDLAKVAELRIGADIIKPELCSASVLPKMEIFVELEGLIDKGKEKERLTKELEKTLQGLESIAKKLSNKDFIGRAPAAVVETEKAKQQELTVKKEKLIENIARLV